jgi:hypothetical protein
MRKTLRGELLALSIFAVFLSLYLLTANELFSFDALTNAIACETAEPVRWFHSSHPLYPFVGVLWYYAERACGYAGYSIYSLARLNTILMASALALLSRALCEWTNVTRAALVTTCLGVSFAVWQYAVDGRAVGASVFGSALVIVLMMKMERAVDLRWRHFVLLGCFSAITTLMHGIAIFHCAPVAVWTFRKRPRGAVAYAVSAATIVTAMYVGCYAYVHRLGFASSFFSWALGYAGFNGAANAPLSPYWATSAANAFNGLWVGWRNALFAAGLARPWSLLASAIAMLVLAGIAGAVAAMRRESAHRSLFVALFAWGALVMGFLAFWSPGQEGFRLHALIPWAVVVAVGLGPARWIDWSLVCVAVALFTVNFFLHFYPSSFISHNRGYQTLNFISERIAPGDVVLTGPAAMVPNIEVLRPYFFPQIKGGSVLGRLFAFHEDSLAPLTARLRKLRAQGHSVYLSEDLFDPDTQRRMERQAGLEMGSVRAFVDLFATTSTLPLPDGGRLIGVEFKNR